MVWFRFGFEYLGHSSCCGEVPVKPTVHSLLTASRGGSFAFSGFNKLLLGPGSRAGLLALLRAVGERIVFLLWLLLFLVTALISGGFLRNLLHGGTLLLKRVVTTDVVRVLWVGTRIHIRVRALMGGVVRSVVVGVLHDTVDE